MKSRLHSRPFTLLEVVIAISLLTSVLVILYLGLYSVMHSWDRQTANASRFDTMLTIDRTVDQIFSGAIPFTWPDETVQDMPVFVGQGDNVTLAYLHQVNRVEDGAIRFCHLRLEDNQLVVYYCERPPFPLDFNDNRLRRSVLASGVESIEFSYADYEDEAINFVTDLGRRLQMPLAIQLRIRWEDGTEHSWLRRTAGSSYYERFGDWKRGELP